MIRSNPTSPFSVELLDENVLLSLEELSRTCSTQATVIVELVQEGIITAQGPAPEYWRFAGTELRRAFAALRLQRDLGVNWAGAALALQLLEELQDLRSRADERD